MDTDQKLDQPLQLDDDVEPADPSPAPVVTIGETGFIGWAVPTPDPYLQA